MATAFPTNWDYMPNKVSYSNFTGYGPAAPLSQAGQKSNAFNLANMPKSSIPVMGANKNIYNPDWTLKSDQNANQSPFGANGSLNIGSSIPNNGLGQGVMDNAHRQLGFGQAPGVPMGGAMGELNQQFNDAGGAARSAANTELTRRGAFEGGTLDLAQQRARADESIQLGDLWRRLQEQGMNNQQFSTSSLLNLLAGL